MRGKDELSHFVTVLKIFGTFMLPVATKSAHRPDLPRWPEPNRARATDSCRALIRAILMVFLIAFPVICKANQVTNPYFTGTTTAATSWTSSAAGTGAAFNHALSAANATITAAGGSTEFYSGCVGAACLTNPFVSGTTSGAQQSVITTVGQSYTISFWTYFSTANNAAVEIDVYWGSTKIYAGASVAAAGWSQHTLSLGTAASSSNTLTVMIRDDPSYSAITGVDIEPVLGMTKVSNVVSDPVNGTTNPRAIPGATVHYCVTITNPGTQSVGSVVQTDPLPSAVTFVAGTLKEGTTCANATTAAVKSTISGTTITSTLGTMAAGASYAVVYDVTIN